MASIFSGHFRGFRVLASRASVAALAIFAVRGCRKNARMRDAAGTELAGIDSKQLKPQKLFYIQIFRAVLWQPK